MEKLKRWTCRCCWMSASRDSKNVIPIVCESKHVGTTHVASSCPKSLSNEKKNDSVEDEIEQSKVHWSQLREYDNDNNEVGEVSNVEVFKSLQMHPTWGDFFRTFGDGELVVGEKFAAGAQAELYHVRVTWKKPLHNTLDQNHGVRWVLKVFQKGTFLRDLQKQWPQGMFRNFTETQKLLKLDKSLPSSFTCSINCGTLLPDGRFGFLLRRESEDLQTCIDRMMKPRTNLESGPFPMQKAFMIMYIVAKGMNQLHNLDIVHRDLKASNVLCTHFNKNTNNEGSTIYIADFECSIGVVGTGFFRAPEILQALKNKVLNERPNLFTKALDVYSYGMVCYEILTGKLPFEGHPTYDFDLVLCGQQLEVPHDVDKWVYDLLRRCWELDPTARPTFGEILKVLEANSKACEGFKEELEQMEMLPLEEQTKLLPIYEFES